MALGQEPLEMKPEQPDAKSEDADTDRDEDVRHADARLEGGPLQEGQARRRLRGEGSEASFESCHNSPSISAKALFRLLGHEEGASIIYDPSNVRTRGGRLKAGPRADSAREAANAKRVRAR